MDYHEQSRSCFQTVCKFISLNSLLHPPIVHYCKHNLCFKKYTKHSQPPHTHLAAMPPWRRLETRGLPSLSMPPDTVRPRVVPSFLMSSTVLVPLNSSVKRKAGWGGCEEVGEDEQRQEMRGLQEQKRPADAIPLLSTERLWSGISA